MASVNPLSIGAMPVGANAAYGIGPSVAATVRGGSAACDSRSEITANVASAPSPCASIRIKAPISSVTGLQITRTSSPADTPMHCRTTVRTALSRSAPLTRPD